MKADGPRLVELLPPGLRRAIDYPGGYRARDVFDEVIANVYALMVGRGVHHQDYSVPTFLHSDVYSVHGAGAVAAKPTMSETPNIHGFPATKLGAFLRAMEDPEGTGDIDAHREREIAKIEERLADSEAPVDDRDTSGD